MGYVFIFVVLVVYYVVKIAIFLVFYVNSCLLNVEWFLIILCYLNCHEIVVKNQGFLSIILDSNC